METTSSIPKISFVSGICICILLIISFVVMKNFEVLHFAELRFLNIFILIVGLIATFRYYRMKTKILNIPYVEGLWLGMFTTFIGCLTFGIFIFIYFYYIDTQLLLDLKDNTVMMGASLTASAASLSSIVEGLCAGGIITFIIMQYYKSGFYKTRQEAIEKKTEI